MSLWVIVTVLFLAVVAVITEPPCDKPVSCPGILTRGEPRQPVKKEEKANLEIVDIEQWVTSEGILVHHLFKSASTTQTVQLLLNPVFSDADDGGKESAQNHRLRVNLLGDKELLPDTEGIKHALDALGNEYATTAMSITIEGNMAIDLANARVAEIISHDISQHRRVVSNSALD